MSERIRGLSIDLDVNDSKVVKSIANVRRAFRAFDSEIRTNLKNFQVSEKTMESYNQVTKDLSGNLKKQKEFLNQLNREYAELEKSGKGSSREAMNLATEISKQADNVNYLEHQLKKINKEFEEFQRQQRIAESGWGKLGQSFKQAGDNITSVGKSFQNVGSQIQGVGSTLTNSITKPALGATTAIAGMFTGLGIKRLVAIDEANAKMRGLGFEAEKYAETVKDAVDGTLLTYAEGMDITAGALSAGVKEGKELEKYIRMIGNASAASGRQSNEMALIFNRVVGGGRLMTQELNMIEDGMPGFSKKMAEHLGVPQEEFRKMVTAGQVSSDEFLTVMDDFSGELSKEMASTFPGLVKNTFARIGKIGEEFWGGTYDKLKDQLALFAEYLTSDELKQKAAEWGEIFAEHISKVIGYIHKLIDWWSNLSTSTKKMIGIFTGIAVALGPAILILGKFVGAIGSILTVVGPVVSGLGGLFTGIAKVTKGGMAFATVFPKLSGVLTFMTGPIGIAIASIIGIGTAFAVAYKKSETFRNIVHGIVDVIKKVIQWFVDFNKAILDLFKGDEDNGKKMLEKLGLSESMIKTITTQIEFVKNIFSTIFDTVSKVFTAIGDFIKEIINELVLFWQENGQMITDSVATIFKGIFEVISNILNFIFEAISAFIEMTRPIWETFLNVLKTAVTIAWNAIKLVIGTVLDVIKGIILAVTALIQGDWGAFLTAIRSTAESIWNRIKEFITSSVTAIKDNISNYITLAFNIMKNLLTQMWNNTKQRFTDMVNTAKDKLTGFRDAVKDLVTQAKNRALEQIDKIVDGAKAMPGKMRDAIVNGKNKVVSGIKSLGNAMAGQLGKVVNGVIGGMNSVLGKIGITAKISEWTVPSFSRGTTGRGPGGHVRNDKIARDTLALVGDKGPGNGPGTRELVQYPNGKFGLYDNDQMIFAPKGTKIFNNKLTEEMLSYLPAFSRGTTGQGGLLGKAVSGVKKAGSFIGGGIKNIAEKAIDFLDAPKKVFDSIVNAVFGGFTGINEFMLQFAKGGWNKMKEALFDFLKCKFSEASIGKKQKWMNYPMTTPYAPGGGIPGYNFNGGRHYGIDYGTPVGVNVTAPTPGRVTRQYDHGGGIVARLDTGKASQYFLHMSSVKSGKVAAGESVGKSGNTGAFTTGPHIHWQLEDPKTPFLQNRNYKNPLSIIKGHQFGGLIESEGLFRLGEGNNPEVVIPLNEPSEAMKLIAYVAEKLKGKSKQTSQLPDYRNNQDDSLMNRLIETQQEQIELLKSLLMKDTDIYMDGEKLSKDVDRRNLQREKRYDRFKGGVYI